eukprot:2680950-Pyramimonas_sp.AAC.1
MPPPAAQSEQLYGPRPSVQARWPDAKDEGGIWNRITENCPREVQCRPWFDGTGNPLISGSPENVRNVRSAQRKYCGRMLSEGIDYSARGEPCGYAVGDRTELLAGEQLAMAFYMAHKQDPKNTHVERCLAEGYKVAVWPRNMPIEVTMEIVKHMNKFHDGIANTPADMTTSVPHVEA